MRSRQINVDERQFLAKEFIAKEAFLIKELDTQLGFPILDGTFSWLISCIYGAVKSDENTLRPHENKAGRS